LAFGVDWRAEQAGTPFPSLSLKAVRWDHSPFSPQLKPRTEAATPPVSRKSDWMASDVAAPTTMSGGYERSFSGWPTGGGTKKGKKHYE